MKSLILCLVMITLILTACVSSPAQSTATVFTPVVAPTEIPTNTPIPTDTITPTLVFTPTITTTSTPGIGSSLTSPLDGMVMVYVPAGSFLMGFSGGYPDEQPEHTVALDAFWIDKTEITNGAYEMCVKAGVCKAPSRRTSNGIDAYYGNAQYVIYPVIFVSWMDAQSYCNWAGLRLPTEAEWEKAARGIDGRLYPWGNTPPDKSLANFDHNIWDVTQVGSYPAGASPYGALDMAGNIWEWTADWYGSGYYSQSPAQNPTGPDTGTKRVLRGGSWNFDAPGTRTSYRFSKDPAFVYSDIGFRCVLPAK